MHYWPSFTEHFIMNMPYDNYAMYLASIPKYESKTDDEESEDKPTGAVNLFNIHD